MKRGAFLLTALLFVFAACGNHVSYKSKLANTLNDSVKFGTGMFLVIEDKDSVSQEVPLDDNLDSIIVNPDLLNNSYFIRIIFDEKINGYSVSAEIHPDERNEAIGMARFIFTKQKATTIETPFCWRWFFYLEPYPVESDSIKYVGEQYHVGKIDNMVQSSDNEFVMIPPFFFYDIDSDDEQEVCFPILEKDSYFIRSYELNSKGSKFEGKFEVPDNE